LQETDERKLEMLKTSFLKANRGSLAGEIQMTSSSTKVSSVETVKELLLNTPGWQAAVSVFNSKEFVVLPHLTTDFAKSFLVMASTHFK
jgi:hypothetical protein